MKGKRDRQNPASQNETLNGGDLPTLSGRKVPALTGNVSGGNPPTIYLATHLATTLTDETFPVERSASETLARSLAAESRDGLGALEAHPAYIKSCPSKAELSMISLLSDGAIIDIITYVGRGELIEVQRALGHEPGPGRASPSRTANIDLRDRELRLLRTEHYAHHHSIVSSAQSMHDDLRRFFGTKWSRKEPLRTNHQKAMHRVFEALPELITAERIRKILGAK